MKIEQRGLSTILIMGIVVAVVVVAGIAAVVLKGGLGPSTTTSTSTTTPTPTTTNHTTTTAPTTTTTMTTTPAGQPLDGPFEWVSDIAPGSGAGTPPGGPGQDGPWNHRVMSATSSYGLIWVKDNIIIADQASVPDAILDNEGNMRVYYVDWYNGHVISVALSQDGTNWIYRKVTIQGEVAGSQSGISSVDPDIVLLSDGRYKLYYMYGGEIRSAVSDYGINFVKESGVRFQGEAGEIWMDPDVVKMGDVWRMFTWRAIGETNQVISAVSADGLNFTKENVLTTVGNISCTISVEGGYRMYYVGPGISSAFSNDGVNWAGEGMRLDDAADPTVIRLQDMTYKMFYKSWIE